MYRQWGGKGWRVNPHLPKRKRKRNLSGRLRSSWRGRGIMEVPTEQGIMEVEVQRQKEEQLSRADAKLDKK